MSDSPEKLKPLQCHGVNLQEQKGGDWVGDCPFCGKEDHMYASAKTGLWDCKVCGASGNAVSFLTKYADKCLKATRKQWTQLFKLRGIPAGIMKKRGMGWSSELNEWLIPIRSKDGTVRDIRRWNKKVLKSTWGVKTHLFGADWLAASRQKARVWLCEGEWDAMAMDWLLREIGADKREELAVAVPGAGVFKAEWSQLFAGKRVIACYDADDAGERGELEAKKRLKGIAGSLEYVRWPDRVKKGFDLRDFITAEMLAGEPQRAMGSLMTLVRGEPKLEVAVSDEMPSYRSASKNGSKKKRKKPQTIEDLTKVFAEHLTMGSDMKMALRICIAICLSNKLMTSDPLWAYMIAPAGSGKTVLLSTLQSSGLCVFRSTVTPHCLVSGWRGEGGDPSLIPQLAGRTFVAKDFTEILTLPGYAQDEIFSTLRGAYDGQVSKTFGNGITREYKGCYFSMLAGVTPAIHSHAKASLGERFLKFQFRTFSRAHQELLIENALDNIGREQEIEETLQEAVAEFMDRDVNVSDLPKFDAKMKRRISSLVQLIAHMRAQVERDPRSGDALYRPMPEVGSRLVKQLGKLAMLVAYLDGKDKIDEDTYKLIERVAFDTAYGFHLDVISAMMELGGMATKAELVENCALPLSTLNRRIDDLTMTKAIEHAGKRASDGGRPSKLFQVTDHVAQLWKEARGEWKTIAKKQKTLSRKTGKKKRSSSSKNKSAVRSRKS